MKKNKITLTNNITCFLSNSFLVKMKTYLLHFSILKCQKAHSPSPSATLMPFRQTSLSLLFMWAAWKKCIIKLSVVLLRGCILCVCVCGSITGMQDPPPLETGGASSPSDVMTAASAVSSALSLFAADRFLLKGNIWDPLQPLKWRHRRYRWTRLWLTSKRSRRRWSRSWRRKERSCTMSSVSAKKMERPWFIPAFTLWRDG